MKEPGTEQRAALLLRAPLFAALPRPELVRLASAASRRRLRSGAHAHGIGDRFVLALVTGRLEVVGEDGEAVRSLLPPAVVGVSMVAGVDATAELRAAEPSEVLVVPASAFAAVLRRSPQAALAVVAHLAALVAELSLELQALRRHGVVERVRHRLRQLGASRRVLSITHAQLAAELGASRANVSRALARLEEQGLVRRQRGRIELR